MTLQSIENEIYRSLMDDGRKKRTPNFTFLGVKLGVNLVNH